MHFWELPQQLASNGAETNRWEQLHESLKLEIGIER